MGRGFNTGRFPIGEAPSILGVPITTGQTFKIHALVKLVSGKLTECGADPASVLGVALQGALTGYGQSAANSPTVVTGISLTNPPVSVAIADRATVFSCRGIDSTHDPLVPVQADVGLSFGVAKVGDDWVLDHDETVAKVVTVVDIDTDYNIFFVKFVEAVLQTP